MPKQYESLKTSPYVIVTGWWQIFNTKRFSLERSPDRQRFRLPSWFKILMNFSYNIIKQNNQNKKKNIGITMATFHFHTKRKKNLFTDLNVI